MKFLYASMAVTKSMNILRFFSEKAVISWTIGMVSFKGSDDHFVKMSFKDLLGSLLSSFCELKTTRLL